MRAFIYSGGKIYPDYITEAPKADDLIIAADSGYDNARRLGVSPSVLIGDFDSLESVPSDVAEVLQLPCEKDLTDTQFAVETAIERGADEIIIVCGTGGRLDHTMSTLAILESIHARGVKGYIVSGQNRIRYIKNSGFILLRSKYKYFSLLAVDERVKGVSIEGCKYPLKKKTLYRSLQFAVSNEIEGNCALITVKRGAVYLIESRDMT